MLSVVGGLYFVGTLQNVALYPAERDVGYTFACRYFSLTSHIALLLGT